MPELRLCAKCRRQPGAASEAPPARYSSIRCRAAACWSSVGSDLQNPPSRSDRLWSFQRHDSLPKGLQQTASPCWKHRPQVPARSRASLPMQACHHPAAARGSRRIGSCVARCSLDKTRGVRLPSQPSTQCWLNRYSCAAASRSAMMNFVIFIIACMAFGCFNSSPMFFGTICQDRPNLSSSQPHSTSLPPSAVSACQ